MKKTINILIITIIGLITMAMSSCNNTPSTTITEDTPTIYFLSRVLGNQYWSIMQAGANAAGRDLGVNVVTVGLQSDSDIETQTRQLQDAVTAGASAIVIAPIDSIAMAPAIEEVYKLGIPIVIVDTMIDSDYFDVAFLTNNVEAGRLAAHALIDKMLEAGVTTDEIAEVATQITSNGSQTIMDRLRGFTEYWAENAPHNWTILEDDIKINDGNIDLATTFGQDFLTTYPNLRAFFSPNNGSTVGFVTALRESNRDDIVLVGFDFSAELDEFMRLGNFTVGAILQRPYFVGYESITTALNLANGATVDEKIVNTVITVVDINNLDSYEVQSIINP